LARNFFEKWLLVKTTTILLCNNNKIVFNLENRYVFLAVNVRVGHNPIKPS